MNGFFEYIENSKNKRLTMRNMLPMNILIRKLIINGHRDSVIEMIKMIFLEAEMNQKIEQYHITNIIQLIPHDLGEIPMYRKNHAAAKPYWKK